jgi:uncharacterized protein YcbX
MQLSQIIIYPIKGLPGISLRECGIEARGLKYDRRFMLVDEEGLFISQRSFPKLTQCKITLQDHGFFLSEPNAVAGIFLPLECSGSTMQVKVWEDVCEAVVCAQPINDWFSHFLGISCKLVYMHNESQRFIDATYNPGNSLVSFADGFPFLLLGQSSLDDINVRLSIRTLYLLVPLLLKRIAFMSLTLALYLLLRPSLVRVVRCQILTKKRVP